jgi:hypothetical protein
MGAFHGWAQAAGTRKAAHRRKDERRALRLVGERNGDRGKTVTVLRPMPDPRNERRSA